MMGCDLSGNHYSFLTRFSYQIDRLLCRNMLDMD